MPSTQNVRAVASVCLTYMYGVPEVVPVVNVHVRVVQPVLDTVWAVKHDVLVEPLSARPISNVLKVVPAVARAWTVKVYLVFETRVEVVSANLAPSVLEAVVTTFRAAPPIYCWEVSRATELAEPNTAQPVEFSSMEPLETKLFSVLLVISV